MKRVVVSIAFILVSTLTFANIIPFESSRQKETLSRALESALAERDKIAFTLKASQAAGLAYTLWEKEALFGFVQTGDETDEGVYELQQRAKHTIEQMLIEAEGRFEARCAEIVMPKYAKEELLEKIQMMKALNAPQNMVDAYRAWNEAVGGYVEDLLASVGIELGRQREDAIADIGETIESYRDGFIKEIDARIARLKKEAQREIELYYIGARNAYMAKNYTDTKSLRRESEQQSAESITQDILSKTQDTADALAKQVEEKLVYVVNGVSIPQTDDIEQLIQAGIYAWKAAEDKLIAKRFEWERAALTNYESTNAAWENAFNILRQKQSEWYLSIQRQIRQGIINWEETFLQTDRDFAGGLKLLDETIQTEIERFDDYSASIRDLIVTGSTSLKMAYDNIGWLREYSQTLGSDSNLLQIKQAVDEQLQNWRDSILRYNQLVARLALQYHEQDMWAMQKLFVQGEFVKQYCDESYELAGYEDIFKTLYIAVRKGNIGNSIQGVNAFQFTEQLCQEIVTIQFVYLLSERFVPFDEAFGQLVNRYGSGVVKYRSKLAAVYNDYVVASISYVNGQLLAKKESSGWIAARLDNFRQYVLKHDGSFEALFGYTTGGSGLLADNRYDETGNPLYQFYWYQDTQGIVLIDGNYPVTHDPYLMTQTEFELEKEKCTLAYWEERYQRAKKLYEYAYNEASRPDAQTQKKQLQQAIDAYNKAKEDYYNALSRLKGKYKDTLIASQQDVDEKQKFLEEMRLAYYAAQMRYQEVVELSLYYTNPLSCDMAIQMVQGAASTIIQIKNRIQDKEKKLFSAKLDYFKALILSQRHRQTAEYALRIEKAVRALAGNGEIPGFGGAYNTWDTIVKTNNIDGVIAAIEENADAVFVKIEELFEENPEDEDIGFLTQGLKRREEAKLLYVDAVEVYNQWKLLNSEADVQKKSRDAAMYILNGMMVNAENDTYSTEITWQKIQEQIEYLLSEDSIVCESAVNLLIRYSAGLLQIDTIRDILSEYTGLNGDEIKESIEAVLLTNILMKRYGIDTIEDTQSGLIYKPCAQLYEIYEEIIDKQHTKAAANLQRAVATLGQTITELYEITHAVAKYCLKDMRNENLQTSPYTKDNILQAATIAEKEASGGYFDTTQATLTMVKKILEGYRQRLQQQEGQDGEGENGQTVNGDSLYKNIYALCKDKIVNGSSDEGLQYAYMFTVLLSMEENLCTVKNVDELNSVLENIESLIQDLNVVKDLYTSEVSECKSETDFNSLIKKYNTIVDTGKDSNGNELTEEQKNIAKIKFTALIHPEVFDIVRPVDAKQRHAFVKEEYARYVEKYYKSSLEYARRVKEEGWMGTLARIFGLNSSDSVSVELQNPKTVATLLEYGKKAESYIQTHEFGKLPVELRQALLSIVDRYHALLAKRTLYENIYTSEDDARTAYQQAEMIYSKLAQLQDKYGKLIQLKRSMYSDDRDNSYTQQRYAYNSVVPRGTWPAYTDAMITTLKECEAIYNEIKAHIENSAFHTIQANILTQLSKLEKIRSEYELVDYSGRFLVDSIGAYGTLDEYCQRLRGQGKTEEFVIKVKSEIEKQLAKRGIVDQLTHNEVKPDEVQQGPDDNLWILAAYYEGIKNSIGDIENFNAFAYSNDFILYALGLHFQNYVYDSLKSGELPTLEALLGYIDDSEFVAGRFGQLVQYKRDEVREYFKKHYNELQAIYYETLTNSLIAQAYKIDKVQQFTASSERDILAHFVAYCIELADSSGTISEDFTQVFGNIEEGNFMASGFTSLTQYGDDDNQHYFKTHYDVFHTLFVWLQKDTAALSLAWLPQGVREYALQREYYLQRKGGMIVDSVEKLFAYYGVDAENEVMVSSVESFVHLTNIAMEYDGTTPLKEYCDEHRITLEKERNYIIMATMYPELADPVNLIVSDSQVPLVFTGLQLQYSTEELFETIGKDDENGLQSLLALCIYAAQRDKTIAGEVYQFILATRPIFSHFRDYLPSIKYYYEDYVSDENSLSPFKDFIVNDVDKLKNRKLEKGENTGNYKYYDDANQNGTHDEGEKYLADFLEEYRSKGFGLAIENRQSRGIDDIVTDAGNIMGYFTGDIKSYFNAILEEATNLQVQFDLLVKVAQMAVEESSGFVLTGDDDRAVDMSFIRDYARFMDEIALITEQGGQSNEEGSNNGENNNGERLPFTAIQQYLSTVIRGGSDVRVEELVDNMRDREANMERALIDAYKNIEKMGKILENANLAGYLKSVYFTNAESNYVSKKVRFEEAQKNFNNALNAYNKAQNEYIRQLEIISILYNRLEEARKLKEDEELLYAYASTPYLFNSQTNAEGGDEGISKLKADARQQYELAQKYRDEVQQKIQNLQKRVDEVKKQNVENDQQYIQLQDEIRGKAQRAYRMEKLAMCMQQEIKKLSVAYEEAKAQYETTKDAFLQVTDKEYEDERNRLVDRMIDDGFVNGVTNVAGFNRIFTQSTLLHHLQTAAYYYNEHHSWYGVSERILNVKPYFGSMPEGNEIEGMDSPLYEYLLMVQKNDKKVTGNHYIQQYFNEFLRARNYENKYDNLMVNYLGTYQTIYKPSKKMYDYLYNKTIKVLGKKVHPLRNIAKSYYKIVLKPIVLMLDLLYKPIIEAEQNIKTHDNNAKAALRNIHSTLTKLQAQKIVMLQAKASLARYAEIASVDGEVNTGVFVYYNPKTRQKVVVQKPTLKMALQEIAKNYGVALKESDLEYMVVQEKGGDYVNVTQFTNKVNKTDENGYETDELIQVYHAGTVSQTYATIMNQQRRSCLARYINYTKSMYTGKGYDRVVIDRAVEKELFGQFAQYEQSALQIGAESKGTVRAMIAYMGYLEGIPVDVINELDAMMDSNSQDEIRSKFMEYVKQYEGINDRELKQRRDLQVYQWQLTKKLLQDKKDDWDRMTGRIFERGLRQWDMMLQAFANRWKNWQSDTKEKIVVANRQWDQQMKQLEQAKLQWFADVQKNMSAKELHSRLSTMEVTLNQLLSHMKEKYGGAIATIDVHAMLLDLLKEQPELLSDEVMALTKTKVNFGLTKLTTRKYNRAVLNEAKQLAEDFAQAQQKIQNIQMFKALTELLKRCRQQIEAANEQARNAAEQFVSAYDFNIRGDTYRRRLPASNKEQVLQAYRPFVYEDELILGTHSIPAVMEKYQSYDGIHFAGTMNAMLTEAQMRMGMLFKPDEQWGFTYYVGEFGKIEYD
ncbi:MAG: hypothetical protein N3F66_05575, partial [Spirochaetes bacterium]|nr:hypothetical protein [Spirochaetota bacterium]